MPSVPLPNNSDNDRSAVPSEFEQPGDGTEGTVDRLYEAQITWHFVGGKTQAVACLQVAIQAATEWSDWSCLRQARKMFTEIQESHGLPQS